MANLRFLTLNLVQAFGALKNGTGGGAPARDEVAPYVMENAMDRDRRTLWQQSSGAGMTFDIDLLAAKNVTYCGIHGLRGVGGGGVGVCDVQYATSYPPGGWTNFGTLTPAGARDAYALVGQQNARYWRFDFSIVSSAFSIGKLWLGVVNVDLGFSFTARRERPRLPTIIERSMAEDPFVTVRGDVRTEFEIDFFNVTATTLSNLRNLVLSGNSFIMLDFNDNVYEVICPDSTLEVSTKFAAGATALYDVTMRLETLG